MPNMRYRYGHYDKDGEVEVEQDWTDEIPPDQAAALASYHERVLQTLTWENGGTLVVSRERFERAIRDMKEANPDRTISVQTSLTLDFITVELVDDETGEPIGRRAQ